MMPERAVAAALIHALDLRGPARRGDEERPALVYSDARRLMLALDEVKPIASAPSIGATVRALRSLDRPRSIKRALAELAALAHRAAHGRTKRAERANVLAHLVLLCELHDVLGISHDSDLRTMRRTLDQLLA
jgi:hypothetical protein